ncbi:MAG: N-acetylmuramoyl-L-alanine amidase family protein [Schleiferiaceae bacterium]
MNTKSKSTALQRLSWFLIAVFALPYLGFRPESIGEADRVQKVIIDAGHGGKDPGNLGTRRYRTTEKDVALAVAQQTADKIKAMYPDVEVVLTRNSDRFLELYERTAIANREKGDLFISIHCDAAENKSAFGSTTYVMGKTHDDENQVALRENSVILMEDNYQEKYEGFDPRKPESFIALTLYQYAFQNQSIEFAQTVQNAFKNDVGRRDRGVRQQPLYVTSRCSMPSVLIELGFTTHSEEEDYLHSAAGQDALSTAIARSFGAYKVRRERGLPPAGSTSAASSSTATAAETPEAPTAPAPPKVEFCIQLSVSGLKKPTTEAPFAGLDAVWIRSEGRLYRYLQGHYTTLDEAKKALPSVQAKGFADAFIVAYRGTDRISVSEAESLTQ